MIEYYKPDIVNHFKLLKIPRRTTAYDLLKRTENGVIAERQAGSVNFSVFKDT